MCEEQLCEEEPYKPNKCTRYISWEDWRKFLYSKGEPVKVHMIDPGYKNEPHTEPYK